MNLIVANHQLWVLLIGSLVPLVTYVVNRVGPWASQAVKAFVLVLAAAVAGGLYTALASPDFGWNLATRELVLTSVIAALGAHQWLWKPAHVNDKLGEPESAVPPA